MPNTFTTQFELGAGGAPGVLPAIPRGGGRHFFRSRAQFAMHVYFPGGSSGASHLLKQSGRSFAEFKPWKTFASGSGIVTGSVGGASDPAIPILGASTLEAGANSVKVWGYTDGSNTWTTSATLTKPLSTEEDLNLWHQFFSYAGASGALGPSYVLSRIYTPVPGGYLMPDATLAWASNKFGSWTNLAEIDHGGLAAFGFAAKKGVGAQKLWAADAVRDSTGRLHCVFVKVAVDGTHHACYLPFEADGSGPDQPAHQYVLSTGSIDEVGLAVDAAGNLHCLLAVSSAVVYTMRVFATGTWTSPVYVKQPGAGIPKRLRIAVWANGFPWACWTEVFPTYAHVRYVYAEPANGLFQSGAFKSEPGPQWDHGLIDIIDGGWNGYRPGTTVDGIAGVYFNDQNNALELFVSDDFSVFETPWSAKSAKWLGSAKSNAIFRSAKSKIQFFGLPSNKQGEWGRTAHSTLGLKGKPEKPKPKSAASTIGLGKFAQAKKHHTSTAASTLGFGDTLAVAKFLNKLAKSKVGLHGAAFRGSVILKAFGLHGVATLTKTLNKSAHSTLGFAAAPTHFVLEGSETQYQSEQGLTFPDPDAVAFCVFSGPKLALTYAIQIPRPDLGNSRVPKLRDWIIKPASGPPRVYRRSPLIYAMRLSWSNFSRKRALELEAFLSNIGALQFTYRDENNHLWLVRSLTSAPEFVAQLEEDAQTVSLELEGERIP